MNKVKKLINKFAISFALIGVLIAGAFLTGNQFEKETIAGAEFTQFETIENSLPSYVKIKTDDTSQIGKVDNTIYLFQPDSYKNVVIGDQEVVNSGDSNLVNYGYYPNFEANKDVFYYFDFQTSLSLYYNLTNFDIENGQEGENLLKDKSISISDFAKSYEDETEEKKPFVPNGGYSFTPQKLDIQFELNTIESFSVEGNIISLDKEGLYTLAIPVSVYITDNGGLTFSSTKTTIYYTFMVFNANTYFDSVTGKPNITTSTNMQESVLPSSSAYSSYYFYNFAYGKDINALPSITYNPNKFEMRISFTDIEQESTTCVFECINGSLVQLDEEGNALNEKAQFAQASFDNNGNVVLSFTKLGSYDLSIRYLYHSQLSGITYRLPLEKIESNNDIAYKNKSQRIYLYGYQAVYSDYSDKNIETNQPESKELKTFDFNLNKYGYNAIENNYNQSADITSSLNNYIANKAGDGLKGTDNTDYKTHAGTQHPNKSGNYDNAVLKEYIEAYINQTGVEPISTNQTPIKFLTNAKNTALSQIYSVNKEDKSLTKIGAFEGFNQNTAGTYVYIIQYTFDSFMSTSGTLQSGFYHYQVFYFEVTNTTPTVTVYDSELNEIYTNGFTNKSVYLLNDAENNMFDANVEITLSAKNYENGQYFFPETNIENLSAYEIYYKKFEKACSDACPDSCTDHNDYNNKVAGKYGVIIENTNPYANALFTIKIKSANSEKASTRTFTIDTNPIENISIRNASMSSSTVYKIKNEAISSYATNKPFIMSWDEKASNATTYGYVKFIPFTSINYYTSLDSTKVSLLLYSLTNIYNTLPVSYKINLDEASNWTEYTNSESYTNTIPSTYVKSSDGIYILEVYDQAGNSSFEIFMKDSTSPIFVQKIDGDFTSYSLISNGETISVPEEGVDISINWTENKAIYIENLDKYETFNSYQYAVDVNSANIKLQEALNKFFNLQENSSLKTISNISNVSPVTEQEGQTPTGIPSYNGTYLYIPIDQRAYVKDTTTNTFFTYDATSYQIDFVDDNGKEKEGTYKFLIRDASNSDNYSEEINYKQYPSSYLSFNVTSDASKLMVKFTESDEVLDYSSYNFTGNLYKNKTTSEYTHIQSSEVEETTLGYKFMYNTPINASKEIKLTFVPVSDNGSTLNTVMVYYYPYEKAFKEVGSNFAYYYTIAQNPTKTITAFKKSANKNYNPGDVETFDISLGSDSFPLAGRYVIERTYIEGSSVANYDYFKRTISFTVDNFNLISPLESVSTPDDSASSLESIVGGDIILSMYSGKDLSSIEVSFPSYNENGLNTGSFYTKDKFTEDENLQTFSVAGNKLPMSLYIPKYKYTISSAENINPETNKKSYSVEENNALSYYGNAYCQENATSGLFDVYVEGVVVASFGTEEKAQEYISKNISIAEYEIKAKIQAEINGKTVYYYSDGQNVNGYLNFYLGDNKGNIIADSPVEYFFEKGTYTVTIYQANNIGITSKFYTFYKFGFEIISQKPDFTVYGSDGYELSIIEDQPNVHYTNSPELTIEWQVPTNKYQAKIDESKISITSNTPLVFNTGEILDGKGTKRFTIDTSKIIVQPNSFIEITMQYEGYNDNYYEKITKRIYFDRSAPLQNLNYLMDLTATATTIIPVNYQQLSMRTYVDYNNVEQTKVSLQDIQNMSYSYSIDNGYFKYFSYNVTTDFFNKTLKNTVINNKNLPYDTQHIYYKEILDIKSYTQVNKGTFASDKYSKIYDFEDADITCGYYEIVEMDYAGNMTVYIVYVIDSINPTDKINNDAISYFNDTHSEPITIQNEQIINGFNIYSNSGFEITNLNYKSDPWAMLNVTMTHKTTDRYMKSPFLQENEIYKVTIGSNEIKFDIINLAKMFDNVESSSSKHQLTFTDRTTGTNKNVYLTIMDASINTRKVEDPNKTSAILNIAIPTQSQFNSTTTSYVYPTRITIHQYDSADRNWKTIMIANQASYGSWASADYTYDDAFKYISFNHLVDGKTLQVAVNLGENASSKIKYEILDNFGNTTTVIQLANEVSYNEISGVSAVYQITENDASNTYVSSNTIKFSFNTLLYSVKIFDKSKNDITSSMELTKNNTTNIAYYTFNPTTKNIFDDYYKLEIRDIEDPITSPARIIHIRLYYKLPVLTYDDDFYDGGIVFSDKNQNIYQENDFNSVSRFSVDFQGKTYTSSGYSIASFDSVTIRFTNGQNDDSVGNHGYDVEYTYSVYVSNDNGATWKNINNQYSAINGYTFSEVGDYLILIKYDVEDVFVNICEIFSVTIIDESLYPIYSIMVDNMIVEKSDIKYTSNENIQYEVNYIVSIDYNDKDNRLTIIENKDKGVKVLPPDAPEYKNSNVYVEIYHYTSEVGVSGEFTIIYIHVEERNNIVTTFTHDTSAGTTEALKNTSSTMIVANNETEANFDKLKLNFSSYYGIKENKINAEVLKLFNGNYVKIDSEIFREKDLSYIYLERAGSYRIKLYDSCTPANVQTFNGSEYINIVFLNSVPFVISYTDDNGDIITTEGIQKAVYNNKVTIKLPNLYNDSYYQTSALPTISVKLNGKNYTNYTTENRDYSFTEPGFYSIKFSAISKTGVQIREEEYYFSIIMKNELKFAYDMAEYNKYYIEKVEKDGTDVTNELISIGNYKTVKIGDKTYLSGLSLANDLQNEKTGDGRYKITVNINSNGYENVVGNRFTFEIRIGHIKSIPINISAKEGESTSDKIIISYNIQNLYNTVGDCYVFVGGNKYVYTSETMPSIEKDVQTISINNAGTYYVQVYTISGRLLYSYKVIKTDPLNAFAIIAIIIGVLAVGAVIGITIAIRKRQKVK